MMIAVAAAVNAPIDPQPTFQRRGRAGATRSILLPYAAHSPPVRCEQFCSNTGGEQRQGLGSLRWLHRERETTFRSFLPISHSLPILDCWMMSIVDAQQAWQNKREERGGLEHGTLL
jgi:hypothetical protein